MNALAQVEPLIDASEAAKKKKNRFVDREPLKTEALIGHNLRIGENVGPCDYELLRDESLKPSDLVRQLGVDEHLLDMCCYLKLVPHFKIGNAVRFLKSSLNGITADSLEAKYRAHRLEHRIGMTDCKLLALHHRLPWGGVKRLILDGSITAFAGGAHQWTADERTFEIEFNKLGRKAFRVTRSNGVPCRATGEERDAMLKKQKGRCAICGEKPEKLFVDHDHDTGAMREGLCHHCNAAIGHLKEKTELLEKAIAYLRRHGK